MILRLDPDYPLVWRTPFSAQFGVDDPAVLLPQVSLAQERMIAALLRGVPRSAVNLIGAESGAAEADVDRFLQLLEPILLDRPADPARGAAGPVIALAGAGPTVEAIAATLVGCGLGVRFLGEAGFSAAASADGSRPSGSRARDAAAARPDLALLVAHFVPPPRYFGLWLSQDVPHLPVVFGDRRVRIGPLIEPGCGPCLYCLHRARIDADAAWPAIASQLWGRRSRLESALLCAETAALASRLVVSRLRDGASPTATALDLDAATGRIVERPCQAHPQCGCRGVERLLAG